MLIALDLTGSDKGPEEVYEGARIVLGKSADLSIVPTGPKGLIDELVAEFGNRVVKGYDTDVVNTPADSATDLLRKNDSATAKAIWLLAKGDPDKTVADAGIFFGDTKAAVTRASIGRERGGLDLLPGIRRPPLALTMPTIEGGRKVYLDGGVTVDKVTSEMLWQFAWLGRAFAQVELKIPDPSVAPHANGEEPEKGDALTKEFFALLVQRNFPGFKGMNAQMTDLVANRFDVVVSDGYGGNKSFKALEAGVKLAFEAFMRHLAKCGVPEDKIKQIISGVMQELSSGQFGAMPLLGIADAIVMIGHGSADREAVACGIERAVHFSEINLAVRIENALPKEFRRAA